MITLKYLRGDFFGGLTAGIVALPLDRTLWRRLSGFFCRLIRWNGHSNKRAHRTDDRSQRDHYQRNFSHL